MGNLWKYIKDDEARENTKQACAEFYPVQDYPPCRMCNGPNDMGEVCAECAKTNDPYFTVDNCGKDFKR